MWPSRCSHVQNTLMKTTSTTTSTVTKDMAQHHETSTNDISSTLHLPSRCTPNDEQMCMGSVGEARHPNWYGARKMAGRIICCRSKTSRPVQRRHQTYFDGNVAISIRAATMKRSNVKQWMLWLHECNQQPWLDNHGHHPSIAKLPLPSRSKSNPPAAPTC